MKIYQWLKCKLGFHQWQHFLCRPIKRCIWCKKEVRVSLQQTFDTGVSFNGFSALRKDK